MNASVVLHSVWNLSGDWRERLSAAEKKWGQKRNDYGGGFDFTRQ